MEQKSDVDYVMSTSEISFIDSSCHVDLAIILTMIRVSLSKPHTSGTHASYRLILARLHFTQKFEMSAFKFFTKMKVFVYTVGLPLVQCWPTRLFTDSTNYGLWFKVTLGKSYVHKHPRLSS